MFLVRTITRAKWESRSDLDAVAADAITGDLRTKSNTLSFWRCASEAEDNLTATALAIAAGRDIDKLEIVWLVASDLRADGQALKNTDGRTPLKALIKRHVDICQLDYVRLGRITDRVVSAIDADQYLRFTPSSVKKPLVNAVRQNRIVLGDLKSELGDVGHRRPSARGARRQDRLWDSQGGLQESPLPQPDRGYGARAGMPKVLAPDILSCLYCHIKRGRRTEDAPGRRKGLSKAYADGCAADRLGRRAGRFRRPCLQDCRRTQHRLHDNILYLAEILPPRGLGRAPFLQPRPDEPIRRMDGIQRRYASV